MRGSVRLIFALALLALPTAAAQRPLLEEAMEKYTFVGLFAGLLATAAALLWAYWKGWLPRMALAVWAWLDERFALFRHAAAARREYYAAVFTLLPATGRTMPQSHTERYNLKTVWYWYPFYCLGGVAFLAFIVLTITGIYLGFYYVPDGDFVTADDGSITSGAYQSMELIMTQVSFGYIIRAVHHWAAHFMVAAVFLHMMRVYFVGAYRNPRELNWVLGTMLLGVTIGFGYTGYLLPWDELGYAAGSIGLEMITAVPVFGAPMAQVVFGGTQLSADTVLRMYWLHIFVLPLVGIGMMVLHMALVWIQGEAEPH